MRSAKLLFDLKVAAGGFPSGSTYLRLLVTTLKWDLYVKITVTIIIGSLSAHRS